MPRSLKLGDVVPLLLALVGCWPVYFAVTGARAGHSDGDSSADDADARALPSPRLRGATIDRGIPIDTDDEELYINHLQRQHCLQDELRDAMGYQEHPDLVYLQGCRYPPVENFERWYQRTRCPELPAVRHPASASLPLAIHTAVWVAESAATGATAKQLGLLLSSIAATQTLNYTVHVWTFVHYEATAAAAAVVAELRRATLGIGAALPMQAMRHGCSVAVHNAVVELASFTSGTCNAGSIAASEHAPASTVETVWSRLLPALPAAGAAAAASVPRAADSRARRQTIVDLFRWVALHEHGGVWLDPTFTLLNDLAPLLRATREFAIKPSMSPLYSAVVMAMQPKSAVGSAVLDLFCEFPKSDDRAVWVPYCTEAGQPCPLDKWYSHSALAWVVRQRHSMVMLPAALFDHDDQCPCLAKKHSRSALHNVFTIKTPGRMGPQAVAALSTDPASYRDVDHEGRRVGSEDCGTDPAFIPPGTRHRLVIESAKWRGFCLAYDTHGGRDVYSKAMPNLEYWKVREYREEHAVWIYHDDSRAIRPSFNGVTFHACLDATVGAATALDGLLQPRYAVCVQDSAAQRWTLVRNGTLTLRGMTQTTIRSDTGLCLIATEFKSAALCGSGLTACKGTALLACGPEGSSQQPPGEALWYAGHPMFIGAVGLRPQTKAEIRVQPF